MITIAAVENFQLRDGKPATFAFYTWRTNGQNKSIEQFYELLKVGLRTAALECFWQVRNRTQVKTADIEGKTGNSTSKMLSLELKYILQKIKSHNPYLSLMLPWSDRLPSRIWDWQFTNTKTCPCINFFPSQNQQSRVTVSMPPHEEPYPNHP